MKLSTEAFTSIVISTALLSAVAGVVLGILLAVDTGTYGPIDELKLRGMSVCRVYHVEDSKVYLCNNGTILVEQSDD